MARVILFYASLSIVRDQAVEVVVPALAGGAYFVATSQRTLVEHHLHFVQHPVIILTTPNLSATILLPPSSVSPTLQRHCLYTKRVWAGKRPRPSGHTNPSYQVYDVEVKR